MKMALQIAGTTVVDNSRNLVNTSVDAARVNSGTLATARLASGTANSSTYLRGDQTWASVPSPVGGSAVFTTSGTFVVPAGITSLKVLVIGGGAGSRGTTNTGNGSGGGGGGGCGLRYIRDLTPGTSITVTIGAGGAPVAAGGTSSFGGYISATGGNVGGATSSGVSGTGGTAGTSSGADFNFLSCSGADGVQSSLGGDGGVAGVRGNVGGRGINGVLDHFGAINNNFRTTAGNGINGITFGGGAGGALRTGSTNFSGASGGAGIIVVEW